MLIIQLVDKSFFLWLHLRRGHALVYNKQDGGQRVTETHNDGGQDDLKLVDYSTDRSIPSESHKSSVQPALIRQQPLNGL